VVRLVVGLGQGQAPKSGQHGSRLKVHPPEKVSGARL